MNFALLGDDPSTLPLLRALQAHEIHSLQWAIGGEGSNGDILQLFPSAQILTRPEELLTCTGVDAVLVADTHPDLLIVARQMAEAGASLLVLPRAAQGGEFVYALSLVRDDTPVTLCPAFLLPADPLVRELRRMIAEGRLGELRLIQYERQARGDSVGNTLSLGRIDEILLQDLACLRWLGGNYKQITALHSGQTAEGVALTTVNLAGTDLPEASLSLSGSPRPAQWQITVFGSTANAMLTRSADAARLVLERDGHAEEVSPDDPTDAGAWVLAQFDRLQAGELAAQDWGECLRVFDTLDAAHRSIARRRTIELHFEATSERSIFKTQMTAAGCGLLTLTLLGLMALLAVGALLERRSPEQVRAENAGFLIDATEFVEGSAELTAQGRRHLEDIAAHAHKNDAPVLIALAREEAVSPLDRDRRKAVAQTLTNLGMPDADARTQIAQPDPPYVRYLMQFLRIAWLIPLLIFLALQFLVFLTRPAADAKDASTP